jgi:hypothetical protein
MCSGYDCILNGVSCVNQTPLSLFSTSASYLGDSVSGYLL